MIRPIRLVLALTVPPLLAVSAGSAAEFADVVQLLDRPDAKWRQGPVKYLLEKDEDSAFRKLKTDEERKAFVEAFWSRRDPSPGTPANEFKERYARRLELVERSFTPPEGRGWEEDRGKAVLLLGPPDDAEIRQMGQPGGVAESPGAPGTLPGDTGAAPRRRATFTWRHEVLPGLPVPLELEFMEESGGGYRMRGRFDFTDRRLTGLEPLPLEVAAAPPPAAPPAPEPPAPPPAPTPQETLIEEVLAAPPPESKIPLAVRLDFYKTSEAHTLATVTLTVRKPASADAAPILAARILKNPDEPASRMEQEDSFVMASESEAAAPGSDAYYQGALEIPPGSYSLVAAVKDPAAGEIGFARQDLEVPDFSQQVLQVSSVTLAHKVERLTGPPDPSDRFLVGNFKVIPSARGEFRPGEDLWLLYQIYSTANDASTGRPRLKVSYQFEKVEETRTIKIGREPLTYTVDGTVQVYSVPIQPAWPAGAYQVVVKVEDLVAGTSVSSTVRFTVVK